MTARTAALAMSSEATVARLHDGVLVAIDVGTSGARAVVLDLDGSRLFEVRRPYPILSPQPGWAEQDARLWVSASLSALAEALRRLRGRTRPLAIGLTGQCPSVVPVDHAGVPVGPGLMYRDNRAASEARELRALFGADRIHHMTGHDPTAFHIAPKLLWLRRHRADVFARAERFLQPRDIVLHALTGQEATDGTHAAGTLLFDLRAGRWATEIFEALGLDPAIVPPVLPSTAVIGELRASLARRGGVSGPLPVIIGGADSQACALGAGVVAPGPISEMAGSSTCLNAAVSEPLSDLAITHYPHVVPGVYTTETGINTTGSAVEWLVRILYADIRGAIRAGAYAQLEADAIAAPPGADGALSLPVFGDGERTDPDLRAAFTGLSQRHGRGVLARAVLEGTAFAMRTELETLARAGVPLHELRVSGGGSRIRAWNRIKADVIGVPVVRVPGDATTTGIAMLAGLGAGVYQDVPEAIDRCVHLEEPIEPTGSLRQRYADVYENYLELVRSAAVRRPSASAETHLETT